MFLNLIIENKAIIVLYIYTLCKFDYLFLYDGKLTYGLNGK
jgi:hypothetical protein